MGRLQVEVQGARIGREGRERGRRRVCGRVSGRPIGSLGGSREQEMEDLCVATGSSVEYTPPFQR
eukprot:scaffold14513_cov276-Alexandrium_tamarense.AAC.2